jgi:tetraprenyl-beta-curcumene synthase
MPLSPRQVWTLGGAVARELFWGLRAVSRELALWRCRALAIPDGPIREDALGALARKRTHADGAALFWILPRRRSLSLLRLLVAYEVIFDFLDNLHEHHASAANSRQLYLALIEALDPGGSVSSYYHHHLWSDDGGYLRALVEGCRRGCTLLPGYARVRPSVRYETDRALVLGINHALDPLDRDAALKAWAQRECADQSGASWFELSGAASASLTVHALLALAADSGCSENDIAAVRAAYFPWVSATCTMLDSYVDQAEDIEIGNHSYVGHYSSSDMAAQRVSELVGRSAVEARRLRNGHRHAVIAACMVAMYLSRDSARVPAMNMTTRSLAQAGGSLAMLLLPVLRLWRVLYTLRSA